MTFQKMSPFILHANMHVDFIYLHIYTYIYMIWQIGKLNVILPLEWKCTINILFFVALGSLTFLCAIDLPESFSFCQRRSILQSPITFKSNYTCYKMCSYNSYSCVTKLESPKKTASLFSPLLPQSWFLFSDVVFFKKILFQVFLQIFLLVYLFIIIRDMAVLYCLLEISFLAYYNSTTFKSILVTSMLSEYKLTKTCSSSFTVSCLPWHKVLQKSTIQVLLQLLCIQHYNH